MGCWRAGIFCWGEVKSWTEAKKITEDDPRCDLKQETSEWVVGAYRYTSSNSGFAAIDGNFIYDFFQGVILTDECQDLG